MRKIYALLLSLAMFFGALWLCWRNVRVPEGTSTLMRPAETEELLRGGNGETDYLHLLNGETVNINTASTHELEKLPSIGEALAEAIVEYREKFGAFETVEDIMKVEKIGEGRFEAIRELIRIE